MIDQTLTLVTKLLNDFLKMELTLDHSLVELCAVPAPHSTAKLLVSLIHIEQEVTMRNQPSMGFGKNAQAKGHAPLYLNLQFLVSVSSNTPYVEGLKYLSLALGYFQQHPLITSEMIELPEGIDKLTFELVDLNAENQKDLWQSLGSSYQPSVVYKIRVLKMDTKKVNFIKPISKNSISKS